MHMYIVQEGLPCRRKRTPRGPKESAAQLTRAQTVGSKRRAGQGRAARGIHCCRWRAALLAALTAGRWVCPQGMRDEHEERGMAGGEQREEE